MGDESDRMLREILTTVKVIAEEQVALRRDVTALQKGQGSLQMGQDSLQKGQDSLQMGQDSLQKGQDSLQMGQDSLQKGQDSLQKGLEELRRVTSVNHYKTIGRIEGLESMLAMHMTDHGHGHDPLGLYPPAKTPAGG